jgi:hypothetical protein
VPTTTNYGIVTPAGGDAPSAAGIAALAASLEGRAVAYFATRSARNTANTAFLALPGNSGKTGMQAYCADLETNTMYTSEGWKYVSPLHQFESTHRGYGSGIRIADPDSSYVDSSVFLFEGVPPEAIISIDTRVFAMSDGVTDQTLTVSYRRTR